MADLRLLSAAVLLAALPTAMACSREIDVPRVAGQLLDEQTDKPIAGAALYMGFSGKNHLAIGMPSATPTLDERIAVTDSDGRFEFPAHSFRLSRFVSLIQPLPGIVIIHRDYGSGVKFLSDDRSEWDRVVLRTSPNQADLRSIKRDCELPCGGLGHHVYPHCYELMCGHPFPEGRKLPEDPR